MLAIIFYGNSLRNKYAIDDEYVTVTNFPVKGTNYVPNNKLVSKGFKGIKKVWQSRYAHDEEYSFDYRPFTTTTFSIEYGLFGQNPFISHLTNLVLYILIGCLIYLNCIYLFRDYEFKDTVSFVTTFIFIIMPSHTEVVDNIKCRDELLTLFFGLLALWSSLKLSDKISVKYLIVLFVSILLGLFCKKTAVLIFAVIPLCFYFYRKIALKKLIIPVIVIAFIPLLHAIIKHKLIAEKTVRNFYHFENPLYSEHFDLIDRILIIFQTFGFYVKFFLIPYPFRAYYGFKTIDVYHPIDVYFFTTLVFISICVWFYWKYRNKHFLFSTLLFLGCIFPFVNALTPSPGIVGERLSFYSSFGFCLMLSFIFYQFFGNVETKKISTFFKKPVLFFLPVIVIAFILTFNRNFDWKNQLTLFEKDAIHLTESAKGNSLLGNQYFELLRNVTDRSTGEKLLNKTLHHYNLAVTADSSFYSAYNNAGVVYYSFLNDYKTAKHFFKLAVRHKKNYPQALENIGNCYRAEKDFEKAKYYYLESIKLNSKQYRCYVAIIEMLFKEHKYSNAIECARIANEQFPNDYSLIALEANSMLMSGDTKSALPRFENAYSLSPNKDLAAFIAKKYLKIGDTTKYNIYKTY